MNVTKSDVRYFFEESDGFWARFIRNSIVILIIVSSVLAIIQLLNFELLSKFDGFIQGFERIVLVMFTIEVVLRWYGSETQKSFWNSSSSWIDILSIVPFYFGIQNTVLLRFFRSLRIMRLSRKGMLDFLESPQSRLALGNRFFIIALILVSAGIAIAQMVWPEQLAPINAQIELFENIVLAIFTVEFLARLFASESISTFIKKPSNWIDFLAIAPFYFGIENTALLRIFRALRLLKLFDSIQILESSSILDFKNSILRVVTPLILVFIFLKSFIWILESTSLWIPETSLGTLFTIVGFSLGVVLSQKIGRSYGKYIQVQDGIYSLHGKLVGLQNIINTMSPKQGDVLIYRWLEGYMSVYNDGELDGTLHRVREINNELFDASRKIGNTELIPFHRLAAMLSSMFEKSISVQSKRTNRTPKTYNLLLQQIIIMYLVLLVVFIPGIQGMISVIFAGYLLYGLFQITDDFDHVASESDTNLITVDALRMKNYLEELREINS